MLGINGIEIVRAMSGRRDWRWSMGKIWLSLEWKNNEYLKIMYAGSKHLLDIEEILANGRNGSNNLKQRTEKKTVNN